jgi:hypothetical protein
VIAGNPETRVDWKLHEQFIELNSDGIERAIETFQHLLTTKERAGEAR